MSDLRAVSLLPFVPSGSDYDASRRLFADLGFQELWENSGYAGFRNGDAQFILQKYDVMDLLFEARARGHSAGGRLIMSGRV